MVGVTDSTSVSPTIILYKFWFIIVSLSVCIELYSVIQYFLKEDRKTKKKAERDKELYNVGVRLTKKYIIENYGLDEDDFTLQHETDIMGQFPLSEGGKKKSPMNVYS